MLALGKIAFAASQLNDNEHILVPVSTCACLAMREPIPDIVSWLKVPSIQRRIGPRM